MRIAIGSDHAGFALKEAVKIFVTVEDREVLDLGIHSTNPVAQLPGAHTVWRDYSDYAEAVRPPSTSSSCRRGISTSWWSLGTNVATGLSTLRSSFHWALLQITLRTSKIMCISMLRVVVPYLARVDISGA